MKKSKLDQCHQFSLIEGAADECLEWLRSNGEEYLKACGSNVGKTREETEALLNKHTAFEEAPKFKVSASNRALNSTYNLEKKRCQRTVFLLNSRKLSAGLFLCGSCAKRLFRRVTFTPRRLKVLSIGWTRSTAVSVPGWFRTGKLIFNYFKS